MKLLYKLSLLSIFVLFNMITLSAQEEAETNMEKEEEEKSEFSLSGTADVYYRANLSAKNNPSVSYPTPGTSFANGAGFSIGMFNLVGAYEGEKAGVVGDLVFGPRGADAVFGSQQVVGGQLVSGNSTIVNQLYAYWNVSDNVTLTIGNFNTFLGYEVISPAANFNYSTSYMFSYGPFSHTGLKADFALGDDASAMLGIFNPTDATEFNPTGSYTIGAQLGFGGAYLNLLYGDQDGALDEDAAVDGETSAGATFQIDLTAGWDLTDALYVGVNTTYNTTAAGEVVKGSSVSDADGDASSFYGFAGYLQYRTSDAFAIGLRGEFFGEGNGGAGAIGAYDSEGDATIFAATVSANINIGNLTLIPELRLDSASEDNTFLDASLDPSSSLSSFLLAAVYSF